MLANTVFIYSSSLQQSNIYLLVSLRILICTNDSSDVINLVQNQLVHQPVSLKTPLMNQAYTCSQQNSNARIVAFFVATLSDTLSSAKVLTKQIKYIFRKGLLLCNKSVRKELLMKFILLLVFVLAVLAAEDDLQSLREEMNEKVHRLERELDHVKSQFTGTIMLVFFFISNRFELLHGFLWIILSLF